LIREFITKLFDAKWKHLYPDLALDISIKFYARPLAVMYGSIRAHQILAYCSENPQEFLHLIVAFNPWNLHRISVELKDFGINHLIYPIEGYKTPDEQQEEMLLAGIPKQWMDHTDRCPICGRSYFLMHCYDEYDIEGHNQLHEQLRGIHW